jgi:hypothetical protein
MLSESRRDPFDLGFVIEFAGPSISRIAPTLARPHGREVHAEA